MPLMRSFGTRVGVAVLEDPMANEGTALSAAERRLQARLVDPRAVGR
jgi:hypothetical protein